MRHFGLSAAASSSPLQDSVYMAGFDCRFRRCGGRLGPAEGHHSRHPPHLALHRNPYVRDTSLDTGKNSITNNNRDMTCSHSFVLDIILKNDISKWRRLFRSHSQSWSHPGIQGDLISAKQPWRTFGVSNDGLSISEIIEISEKAVSAGDFMRAIRLYSAWIDINQSDEMLFLAHFHLGIVYRKNYQFDLAANSFKNSFDLNQEFINSYILMKYCEIMATTNYAPTGDANQVPACSQDKLFNYIIKLRRK
jgi:hypothetical protein